jgi:hypothetical protein
MRLNEIINEFKELIYFNCLGKPAWRFSTNPTANTTGR